MTLETTMDNADNDNDPWAGVTLTDYCHKCGRQLPKKALAPGYCAKCELVNALLVERYTTHKRGD